MTLPVAEGPPAPLSESPPQETSMSVRSGAVSTAAALLIFKW